MSQRIIGLDIGGANLKVAAGDAIFSVPFEMWKGPESLTQQLQKLLCDETSAIAVTMTGELCDCFHTRAEGVQFILDCVEKSLPHKEIKPWIWSVQGKFVSIAAARSLPMEVASANWQAAATWLVQKGYLNNGLYVDFGSTTLDVIPVLAGIPVPYGKTDYQRLQQQELVYQGSRRTPIATILQGRICTEYFASAQDVYLQLGWLPEEPNNSNTADGKPLTLHLSQRRLARMLGADLKHIPLEEIIDLATNVAACQMQTIRLAILHQFQRFKDKKVRIVLAGSGEFILSHAMEKWPDLPMETEILSLKTAVGEQQSESLCAVAVHDLLQLQLSGDR